MLNPVEDLFYTHKWQLIEDPCRIGQEHAKVLMRITWSDDRIRKAYSEVANGKTEIREI